MASAAIIRQELSAVASEAVLFRHGGDETSAFLINTTEDAVAIARAFKAAGADLIDVSSGQVTRAQQVPRERLGRHKPTVRAAVPTLPCACAATPDRALQPAISVG